MNTRSPTMLALSLLAASTTTFAIDLTPLNVNLGAWEITTRTSTQGVLVPPEMLTQMPSAQRAKIAAAMQARSGKVSTQVDQECVTPQVLQEKNAFIGEQDESCSRTVIASTSTRQQLQLSCQGEHARNGTVTVNASSPSTVTSVADIAFAGGGKVHVEIDGRWLGAHCAGVTD
ncbi:DUF3617 domain-containing protein [Dyella tabacisoli]|nr:DUF3617 family protein [Dyella tabacisoli]